VTTAFRIIIGAGAEAVSAACLALGEAMRAGGATPRAIGRAQLLVEEVALNALRHGGAPEVLLEAAADPSGWTLVLEDAGRGFDPLAAPLPAPAASLAEARIGGLGLPLLRRMTRSARYARTAAGLNRLELELDG